MFNQYDTVNIFVRFQLEKTEMVHLSHHAVPGAVDLLAVFAVGDQVEVVGELHHLGDFLQDVDTETFAAAFDVNPWISCVVTVSGHRGGGEGGGGGDEVGEFEKTTFMCFYILFIQIPNLEGEKLAEKKSNTDIHQNKGGFL